MAVPANALILAAFVAFGIATPARADSIRIMDAGHRLPLAKGSRG